MSQHNILRRLRALERTCRDIEKQRTGHLGIVELIVANSTFQEIVDGIELWSLTDSRGMVVAPPENKNDLVKGLIARDYLLLSGIAAVTVKEIVEYK
ncbi:MAG: hypothetical protein AB7E51_08495 [Pseudodesulfovibrio sp.]|uniref:hypothetical protein n=1 Tax=Pseudodesulfovibrio sp. TaxID=2035812 RepID=UPI003D0A25EE